MTSGKKRKKGPPVAAKPKRCFFCGAEGPLTQEHVLPDWLRHLGFKGTGVRELVQDSDVPIIQQGGAFSKTLKIVCADCSNVWMSAMEDDARADLEDKTYGNKSIALLALVENLQRLAPWVGFRSEASVLYATGRGGGVVSSTAETRPTSRCRVDYPSQDTVQVHSRGGFQSANSGAANCSVRVPKKPPHPRTHPISGHHVDEMCRRKTHERFLIVDPRFRLGPVH
jgi:hypothetical protein